MDAVDAFCRFFEKKLRKKLLGILGVGGLTDCKVKIPLFGNGRPMVAPTVIMVDCLCGRNFIAL